MAAQLDNPKPALPFGDDRRFRPEQTAPVSRPHRDTIMCHLRRRILAGSTLAGSWIRGKSRADGNIRSRNKNPVLLPSRYASSVTGLATVAEGPGNTAVFSYSKLKDRIAGQLPAAIAAAKMG